MPAIVSPLHKLVVVRRILEGGRVVGRGGGRERRKDVCDVERYTDHCARVAYQQTYCVVHSDLPAGLPATEQPSMLG